MNVSKVFRQGLLSNNPVLVQLLGMCSTMAISTTLFNGVGMGVSVLIILTCSNIVIALLRKLIPSKVRIACFIVVITAFVTIVDLILRAFVPALSSSLGVFIPLIAVNCIILGRAEAFAAKNSVLLSAADGIGQGLGYTLVLTLISIVREFLGSGTFGGGLLNGGEGIRLIPAQFPALLVVLPFGGFLALGSLIALVQYSQNRKKPSPAVTSGGKEAIAE
ncbi:MAG: electron transport complex subunit RsxE [Oscillospiraceae bacterium]|jgi:electron transport complex protein RnfE|nr:electron transport complex subunit RsxE [Oscillospiraceae bacterium]